MHLVLLRIFHLYRLEGAGPNLQVQAFDQNTGRPETAEAALG